MSPVSRSLFRIAISLFNLFVGSCLLTCGNDPMTKPALVALMADFCGISFLVATLALLFRVIRLARLAQWIAFVSIALLASGLAVNSLGTTHELDCILLIGPSLCALFITIGSVKYYAEEIARQ